MTLVEVMVGVTLGMIVSTALLLLFAKSSSDGQNLQRSSAQIENGRYAMDLLRDEVQLAGFFGELAVGGAAYSTPDPCATVPTGFTASPLALPTPVRGYGSGEVLGCLADRLDGTDALVIRRVDIDTVAPATLTGSNQQYYLQPSFCMSDPVTTPLVFSRNPSDFVLRNRACAAANGVRAYVSRVYFVARCNRCGSGGDSVPTLKRVDLVGNALVETALVEGIETLRLEYGLDTNGDGSADSYATTTAAVGANWNNVVAVRLHLLVRSLEVTSGTALAGAQSFELGGLGNVTTLADGHVRRAYTTTVRLINPSGAREAQ